MASTGLTFQHVENMTFNQSLMAETKGDYFHHLFSKPFLNGSLTFVYFLGLLCCGLKGLVSVFERTGLAGPYRTLVNQLISFCTDQILLFYVVPSGVDQVRQYWGPLPPLLCTSSILLRNFAGLNLALLGTASTVTRYVIVCIFKSMRAMNDDLIAVLIYLTTSLISLLFTAGIHYTSRTVHMFEKICIGEYFEDDYPGLEPISLYIIAGCMATHFIMTTAIARQERKTQVAPVHLNQLSHATNTVLYDTIGGHLMSFVLGPMAIGLVLLVHTLSSDVQVIYIMHSLIFPFSLVFVELFNILSRKKQVRQYIKETLLGM